MAITNLSNTLKERMLSRLDPTKTTVNVGLVGIILLKRNSAGTDAEEYVASGSYGGYKSMDWNSTISNGVLAQTGQLVFEIESGVFIEGYRIVFDNSVDQVPGIDVDTDTYVYDADGTFTINNVEITLN